ncbi:hypothetical protein OTB20_19160 [Streptomyces sp. H27-H1]|uniref:hypothetical protein n=1 Tax=Streptomyces sp. H27-H1 TaxID=2996461 RepID=UPI00226F53AE|nr:hypothetical protein [Streptomyces sp. H27-H1]MCY0928275.1 hypothetical protein [Streptomyces sp. H27-H1]
MKLSKRLVATSAAVLLGTLAFGGAAQAADNGGGAADRASSPSHTIEAPKGTPHVPAKKVRTASKDNSYSQTIEAPAGTEHVRPAVPAGK